MRRLLVCLWACQPEPLPPVAQLPGFRLPLEDPSAVASLVGVDHDPVVQPSGALELVCFDYLGRPFPHCYDEHEGSDYMLAGGWEAMDAGSAWVVAAATGTVESTESDQYDRCHGVLGGVDCDGHPRIANHVILAHPDGSTTLYWHLATASVVVQPGDEVAAGDRLGRVGSSGNSSMPHLHFEVEDAAGGVVDPYVDPATGDRSLWCDQGHPDGLPGSCEG